MRFFTSDLHFGHQNIIKYSTRPFEDVHHMNIELIRRWDSVVSPDDEVWVLGDVAMGKIDESLALIPQLHGRKILVAGNHDRCWHAHGPKHEPWVTKYMHAGFDVIHQGELNLTLQNGETVLVSHFPYEGDSQDKERYSEHRPKNEGQWLLHGHVHEKWQQINKMINVGVDVWDYTPIPETTIIELIEAGPNHRYR